jgi:hypothetical protein
VQDCRLEGVFAKCKHQGIEVCLEGSRRYGGLEGVQVWRYGGMEVAGVWRSCRHGVVEVWRLGGIEIVELSR